MQMSYLGSRILRGRRALPPLRASSTAKSNDRHAISERITGHSLKSAGAGYAALTSDDMAEALKKFPRYTLD
jgi:hypothetical protein